MDQNELNRKFMIFEQQIRQIQDQLGAIEQAILDLSQINLGLDEITGKVGSEIMAPIGRGIFVKAKLLSEELTVDVGNKTFVKKDIPDTKNLLVNQVSKLNSIKGDLEKELEKINQELTNTMLEAQIGAKNVKGQDSHDHDSHE